MSYLISGNEGLTEMTEIQNTASIYFDSNPPVVTNTTKNIMVSEIPTTSITKQQENHTIRIFLNPGAERFQIIGKNVEDSQITLRDLTGKTLDVFTLNNANIIDLSTYPKGIYLVHIENAYYWSTQKIIKQ